jgi:hypothetical protein
MFFAFDKTSRLVKMYSNSSNNLKNGWEEVEVNPTTVELQKLKDNCKVFYKEKLEFEENSFVEAEKKKNNVEQLKKDISSATTVSKLKDVLNSLLDNL